MFHKKKFVIAGLVAILFVTGIFQVAWGEGNSEKSHSDQKVSENSSERAILYQSNRYTQPELKKNVEIPTRPIPDEYSRLAANKYLELYVNKTNAAIMIRNKQSGYVWGSVPEQKVLKEARLNKLWLSKVHSPVVIEYFNKSALRSEGSMGTLGGRITSFKQVKNGFQASLSFEKVNLSLTLKVKIDGNSLVVDVPDRGIKEGKQFKLASIEPYPFLGSVLKARIPGYLFIPDGSGALMRFRKEHANYGVPYERAIYGKDYSFLSEDQYGYGLQSISVPVFGVVHGAGSHAFLGIVENGKYNAKIVANPSGVNTGINWVATKFIVRHAYFQPTSKNMGGINTFQKKRIASDHQIRYMFLEGQDADYVGMAKTYRGYLVKKDVLKQPKEHEKESVPVRLDFLGTEVAPSLLGVKTVKMTTFDQAKQIVGDLLDSGVKQIEVVYRGWSEGGLTWGNPKMFPVAEKLGGKDGLKSLQNYLQGHHIPLYLNTDYSTAYQNTDRFSIKTDAVRKMSNEILKFSMGSDEGLFESKFQDLTLYFMNPGVAKSIAAYDAKRFNSLGIKGIAIQTTSNFLLSDHNPHKTFSRKESAEAYQELAENMKDQVGQLAMNAPNDYLLPYSDQIFDIAMSTSHYMYETDTVPFLQIVFHGYIDYFAGFSNFHANPKEQLLKMIEYGAYPSFYLTGDPSYKLKNTPSSNLFTSQYQDWKSEIVLEYQSINKALKGVQNATIENRTILDWGIDEIKYSNGQSIVVNYTNHDVKVHGKTVKAKSFKVFGGD